MNKEYCDLHMHSTCSDGELTPKALVEMCKKNNLKVISITDHDCVDAYNILTKEDLEGIELIKGCEFVARVGQVPVEILGYGINIKKAKEYLDVYGIPESKLDVFHCKRAVASIEALGFEIDDDIREFVKNAVLPNKFEVLFEKLISNNDIKQKIYEINPECVVSCGKFFRFGLNNPKSPLGQPVEYPPYDSIVKTIHNLGGLAFLAHPYHYKDNLDYVLNTVKDSVDGIECYHHTTRNIDERVNYLKNFARENNLLISGGSDFHNVKDTYLSLDDENNPNVPAEIGFNLKQKLDNLKEKNRSL